MILRLYRDEIAITFTLIVLPGILIYGFFRNLRQQREKKIRESVFSENDDREWRRQKQIARRKKYVQDQEKPSSNAQQLVQLDPEKLAEEERKLREQFASYKRSLAEK